MGQEEVVIWAGRGLLHTNKPIYRKACAFKNDFKNEDKILNHIKEIFTFKKIFTAPDSETQESGLLIVLKA